MSFNSLALLQQKSALITNNDLRSSKALLSVSGTVKIGENKLPAGDVYLLSCAKGDYFFEKKEVVENGNFTISNIKKGNYLIYVIPKLNYDFLYFPKYIPSYFGGIYSWEETSAKNIEQDIQTLSLELMSYQEPFYGEQEISGTLFFNNINRGIDNLPIPVILLNENRQPMDFRIVDKNKGTFSFKYLPEGTYYVHPEIPGFKTRNYKISVGAGTPEADLRNINFFVDEKNVRAQEREKELPCCLSDGYLKILLDEDTEFPVLCELLDLSGRTVKKNIYYSDEILINTSDMATNLYILKVRTFNNQQIKTKKVFINSF